MFDDAEEDEETLPPERPAAPTSFKAENGKLQEEEEDRYADACCSHASDTDLESCKSLSSNMNEQPHEVPLGRPNKGRTCSDTYSPADVRLPANTESDVYSPVSDSPILDATDADFSQLREERMVCSMRASAEKADVKPAMQRTKDESETTEQEAMKTISHATMDEELEDYRESRFTWLDNICNRCSSCNTWVTEVMTPPAVQTKVAILSFFCSIIPFVFACSKQLITPLWQLFSREATKDPILTADEEHSQRSVMCKVASDAEDMVETEELRIAPNMQSAHESSHDVLESPADPKDQRHTVEKVENESRQHSRTQEEETGSVPCSVDVALPTATAEKTGENRIVMDHQREADSTETKLLNEACIPREIFSKVRCEREANGEASESVETLNVSSFDFNADELLKGVDQSSIYLQHSELEIIMSPLPGRGAEANNTITEWSTDDVQRDSEGRGSFASKERLLQMTEKKQQQRSNVTSKRKAFKASGSKGIGEVKAMKESLKRAFVRTKAEPETRFASPRSAHRTLKIIADMLVKEFSCSVAVRKSGPPKLRCERTMRNGQSLRTRLRFQPMDSFSCNVVMCRSREDDHSISTADYVAFVAALQRSFLNAVSRT